MSEVHKKLAVLSTMMSLTEAIQMGKGIRRVTAESEAGRRLTNSAGVLAKDVPFEAMNAKLQKKQSGCGAKETSRRLKQMKRIENKESLQGN